MTLSEILSLESMKLESPGLNLSNENLDVAIVENSAEQTDEPELTHPFAVTEVVTSTILDAGKLTTGPDVKEIYYMELSNGYTSFKPGDTIGILTENRQSDLSQLFDHLGVSHLAETKIKIKKKIESGKKAQPKPPYLDKTLTLNYVFKYLLDIHSVPKKVFIGQLAKYTSDMDERCHLEKLSSPDGSDLYNRTFLEEGSQTFLDLLLGCKTCHPPVACLIENLPRLMARPYSIASSPLVTGMLKALIEETAMGEKRQVKMFFRKGNGFNLPESDVPIVLIGTGTGLAPYLSFFEHLQKQGKKGKIWLFYGCRHRHGDFIFKDKLAEYLESGVLTKLTTAFSRDSDDNKYVQDQLRKHTGEISEWIFNENAIVYVCGDARNMGKDVENTFIEMFKTHKEMTNEDAKKFLKGLQKERRYLQDTWL